MGFAAKEMTRMPRPNIIADERCTFCLTAVPRDRAQMRYGDLQEVLCPCCGTYRITGTAVDSLPRWDLSEAKWAAIAYDLKKMTDRAEPPRLDNTLLRAMVETARLPHPDQILDDLLLWAGAHSRWPGDRVDLVYSRHRTLLGAVDRGAFDYMLKCANQSLNFDGQLAEFVDQASTLSDCSLTPTGWQRYRELSHSVAGRRYGFMAMKFGDEPADAVVRDHFVPQVALAGFDLRRLDEGQGAGLIDDQLRVRIRQARFLICDLTHGNRGAYWEAGFAEGLGIPVIYTCRRDVFDDPHNPSHPHFDAAHWVTVPWEPDNPAPAAVKLKATVRATLPWEAQLED
jgi:hypothetical protein